MRLASLNHYKVNCLNWTFALRNFILVIAQKNSILIGIHDSVFPKIQNVIEKYKKRYPKIVTILRGINDLFFNIIKLDYKKAKKYKFSPRFFVNRRFKLKDLNYCI